MRRAAVVGLALVVVAVCVAAAAAAFVPLPAASTALVYTIPPGAGSRLQRGETLNILPGVVRLTLGVQDVLVIENNDDVSHQVGPIILLPNQTYRIPFRRPVQYKYACTLHASGQLTIVAAPTPAAGWDRLRWRVARYLGALGAESTRAEATRAPRTHMEDA